MQNRQGIGFRVHKIEGKEAVSILFPGKPDEKIDREIAMITRSMLEINVELASYIEVPAVHVEEKQVNQTTPDERMEGRIIPPLIRTRNSSTKPEEAFVSVPYRGYWFWIDDRDWPSKRMFSFLMFVFTLTETGTKEGAPIVTIPAG